MIQLNNDFERQAWVEFAAAAMEKALENVIMNQEGKYKGNAEYAAVAADSMLLELRQRIVQEKDTDGWEYAVKGANYRRKIWESDGTQRMEYANSPIGLDFAEGWQTRPNEL